MKKSLKLFLGILALVGIVSFLGITVGEPGRALGAPITSHTATILPISDSQYDVGTSTNAYREGYFDRLCLTADTCKTAWPALGGGSSDPFTHPTNYGVTTSATATPLWGQAGLFASSTSHFVNFDATNATTTNATSTSLGVLNLTSALAAFAADGSALEYAGASCTNQFIRSLSALGAATCATVANTDLANSSITVNGTSISLGASGTITAASSTLLANNNTWSGGNVFTHSTTTTTLAIPTSATLTTPLAGNVGIDDTTGQFRYTDNRAVATSTHVLLDEYQVSAFFASSTLAVLGKGATTTIRMLNPRYAATTTSIYCKTDTGTWGIQLGHGNASTTFMACSSAGTELTTYPNGSFTAREDVWLGIGSQTSSSDSVTVTITQAKVAD